MRTRVREATPEDVPGIHDLIRQLADYDRESDLFTASVADLEEAMFGDDAILHALVAEGEDGLAGVATWYLRYDTWEGGRTVWLEDLFVAPEAQGCNVGGELMEELGRRVVDKRYLRLEWTVLKWNEPAIGFYRRFGAQVVGEERHTMRWTPTSG